MINGAAVLAGAAARLEVVRVVMEKEDVIDADSYCGLGLLMTRPDVASSAFVETSEVLQTRREEKRECLRYDILKCASCRVSCGKRSKMRRILSLRGR